MLAHLIAKIEQIQSQQQNYHTVTMPAPAIKESQQLISFKQRLDSGEQFTRDEIHELAETITRILKTITPYIDRFASRKPMLKLYSELFEMHQQARAQSNLLPKQIKHQKKKKNGKINISCSTMTAKQAIVNLDEYISQLSMLVNYIDTKMPKHIHNPIRCSGAVHISGNVLLVITAILVFVSALPICSVNNILSHTPLDYSITDDNKQHVSDTVATLLWTSIGLSIFLPMALYLLSKLIDYGINHYQNGGTVKQFIIRSEIFGFLNQLDNIQHTGVIITRQLETDPKKATYQNVLQYLAGRINSYEQLRRIYDEYEDQTSQVPKLASFKKPGFWQIIEEDATVVKQATQHSDSKADSATSDATVAPVQETQGLRDERQVEFDQAIAEARRNIDNKLSWRGW